MLESVVYDPLFGIVLTIATYQIGVWLQRKLKSPLCNPLLVAVIISITLLSITGIPYEAYEQGGQMISLLLGPATVAFAIPLYRQLQVLKDNYKVVLIGVGSGTLAAVTSIVFFSKIFNLSNELIYSLMPKSITTTIGVGVSAELGGYPQITVIGIVITGILGASMATTVCRVLKITDPIAVGLSIGTAAHAAGTSKAMEIGEVEGAMSSLAIVVAGVMTVVIAPIIAYWV